MPHSRSTSTCDCVAVAGTNWKPETVGRSWWPWSPAAIPESRLAIAAFFAVSCPVCLCWWGPGQLLAAVATTGMEDYWRTTGHRLSFSVLATVSTDLELSTNWPWSRLSFGGWDCGFVNASRCVLNSNDDGGAANRKARRYFLHSCPWNGSYACLRCRPWSLKWVSGKLVFVVVPLPLASSHPRFTGRKTRGSLGLNEWRLAVFYADAMFVQN